MEEENKLLMYFIVGIILMPICAYLDYIIIGSNSYMGYVKICYWEYLIFLIGFGVGVKYIIKWKNQ